MNKEIFEKACLDNGVITWENGEIDISPEFVYENMTSSGGLVNKYVKLDENQLHDLSLLVKKELMFI